METLIAALQDLIKDVESKPNSSRYATAISSARSALSMYYATGSWIHAHIGVGADGVVHLRRYPTVVCSSCRFPNNVNFIIATGEYERLEHSYSIEIMKYG